MRTFPHRDCLYIIRDSFFSLSLLFLLLAVFSSCRITKTPVYFATLNKDTTLNTFINKDLEVKIQPNDILNISLASSNLQEDAVFNSVTPRANGASAAVLGYLVDPEGNIEVHYLGKVKVGGMTRKELKEKLQKDLLPYLKEPVVSVSFLNHHITVLGQVIKPGIIQLPEEKISFIDMLALSGEATTNASVNNILVIREEKNGKQFKHINLEDHSLFTKNPEWYYLQPDDIVYVEPNSEKIDRQARLQRNQLYLTTLSAAISIFVIIVDRIRIR